MQQFVHLGVLVHSTVYADHYPEWHYMMVFVAMFVVHDGFTTFTKNPIRFKRSALLVCTTDEYLPTGSDSLNH